MSGFGTRTVKQLAAKVFFALAVGIGLVPLAQAQVNVQDILVPTDIGNQMTATVSIDYIRTSAAPGTVSIVLPATLGVNPPALPAGCVLVVNTVQCAVPAGGANATGLIPFTVRGVSVGSYSLQGQGTGQVGNATSNGSVRDSGDLTVSKTRTAPVGTPTTGQIITFRLNPNIAATGNDIPAGASIVVTDQLPGGATDFNATTATPAACVINNGARTVVCTFSGPLTAAAFNATNIDISGTSGNSGNFVNNASIATANNFYFDRVAGNNTTSLSYSVTPGADVVPTGSSYPATTLVSTTQTLNLVFQNNGPANVPAGGTVTAQVPTGFTVGTLPAGCIFAAPTITCTAAAVTNGSNQSFVIPLGNPATSAAGNITVTVGTPAGVTDYNLGNNVLLVPYSVLPPTGDLAISKAKTAGPLPEGAPIVNTLSVSNADISTVTFTAAGGANPLRIVDDMLLQEVYTGASGGWTCTDNPGVPTATQRRVICERTAAGTLAPGANIPLTINTQVTTSIGATPINLTNTACTGKQALNLLSLADANGPQPRDPNTGNDCQSQGVVGTPVTTGEAQVNIIKESSTDGLTWVDAPAAGPTIVGNNEFAYWRIRFATPSLAANAAQQTIPGLTLTDNLPGILNLLASPPTPAHVTPPITITQLITGGGIAGGCPASIGPGSGALSCNFTNMLPGTTVTLVLQVKRPFETGPLDNTASLSSGNAILSGTTSDAARLIVEPRVDPAVTSKTITPPNSATEPRVGQTVTFTVTLRNHGVNPIPTGNMTLTDTLDPAKYTIISATGADLNCSFVAATGVVTCPTTNAVPRADVRTATIVARLIKPAGVLPNPVYANEINTATVTLSGGLCEFKEETASNALLSTTCNDANSTSNNRGTVQFDIKVPAIDLQVAKSRIAPPGGRYAAGDTLKYLIRMQNVGPSRAENVVLADYLGIPAGFSAGSTTATLVNNAAADTGFVLDTSKTGATVNCSISSTSALSCRLNNTAALNFLDNGREVNFVLEVAYTGPAPAIPATFQNQVVICAAESALYETRGACSTATTIVTPGDNNNTASANDTVFPKVDLSIAKQTLTPSPVSIGQTVQYALTVRNDGPSPIAQILVADVLPANLEYLTSSVALSSYVTGSGTTGINPVCAATPAAITTAGQSQTLNCTLNAVGGPFVGSTNVANTLTVLVTVKPKVGFFTGPYLTNLTNTASVAVGVSTTGDPLAIDSNPANNTATAVVQVRRTSISGLVYEDVTLNREPTIPGGDTPRPNVPITLTGTDIFGNSVTLTTTTALNGSYSFDLPPGTYQISKGADPAGLADFTANVPTKIPFGTTTAPVSPGTPASTVAGTPTSANLITGIQLAAGDVATSYNFGEISGNASIAGRVYVDYLDDGLINGPDVGIPGVTVTLAGIDAFGTSISRTTVTNATGNYSFPGLFAGTYNVTEPNQPTTANGATLPVGFATTLNGKTTLGTGALAQGTSTLPTITPSAITGIRLTTTLALGAASIDNNFGELLPSSISGKVFFDDNNNGTQQLPLDYPLPGVVITLTGINDLGQAVNLSTTTSASGTYSFTNLRAGTYTVAEPAQPPNTGNGITTAGPATPGGAAGVATAVGVVPSAISGIVISRGVASVNNDFAEIIAPPSPTILGSIAGRVWLDTNNNGSVDPGEPGIGGVTIVLTGTTAAGATVSRTLTTRPDGLYEFLDLPEGTYTVTEPDQPSLANGASLPAGIAQTSPGITTVGVGALSQGTATPPTVPVSAIGPIRLGAGQTSFNNNFGEIPASGSSISGVVYLDNNGNGVRDAGDTSIPNVTVTLSGVDAAGQPVARTVITDANGRYEFTGLPIGVYTVTEPTQPPNTDNAETNPGTINNGGTVGTATPRTTVPSAISGIRITAPGTNSPDNNFGEIGLSTISGAVYLDNDGNGVFSPGDTGIPGVTVTLAGVDDLGRPVNRTVVTDANGNYEFTGLRPGSYSVTEPTQPPNTDNAETNPGTINNGATLGTATGRGTVPSTIAGITIVRGGTLVDNNNFGEILPSTISGAVYLDNNTSGLRDPADVPIAGVTITLTGTDDLGRPVTRTTTTDANGRYEFTGLRPGTYTVTEPNQPPNTANWETNPGTGNNGSTPGTATGRGTVPSTIAGITIVRGGTLVDNNNFGEIVPSTISGFVYFDKNSSGVRDAGDTPLVGVTVTLTGVDDLGRTVTFTTVTDANGRYEFPGLRPGTYTVTEPTQPAGTDNAETNPGTINNGGSPGTATTRATLPSAISGIRIVGGGTVSPDNNFGEGGGGPDVVVTKTARTAFFTENNTGNYDISVRNNGTQPTVGDYTAYDLLPITSPQVWRIESASGSGWSCSIGANGLSLACKSSVVLAPGAFHPSSIQVRVSIAEGAKAQAPLRNFTLVRGGGELPAADPLPGRAIDPGQPGAPSDGDLRNLIPGAPACVDTPSAVNQNFCVRETPIRFSVALGGRVWLDGPGAPNTYEPGIDKNYPGWRVLVVDPALYDPTKPGPIPANAIVRQTTTGPDGTYRINNLISGTPYYVFFQDPDGRAIFAGPVNGNNRNPQACGRSPTGGNAPSRTVFLEVTLPEGRVSNEVTCDEQSLPIDPNGVVYDSSSRAAVPGSIVTLRPEGICTGYDPRLHIVGYNQFSSFDAQGNPQMTVGADGFYKFLLTADAPASCLFRLDVTPPPGYVGPSTLIPPSLPLQTPVGVGVIFNVQPQVTAPTGNQTTTYHIVVRSGSTHNDVFNNHIPLDRQDPGVLRIVKTGSVRSIELGDTMEYTVGVTKWNGVQLTSVRAIDTLPAGFRYISGTFRINGVVQPNPAGGIGPVLTFALPNMVAGQTINFTYRVRVGIGAQEGDGVNRVRATGQAGPFSTASNIAEYKVRVDGGVFTNEACVIGKVYVDCNNNHVQDNEEVGIPGVRLYFDDGTFMVSDVEGKYSVCGRQPRTYTLKVDQSTLPRGSRLTTTSGRNVGDANSLFVDLKNGEMQRADFAEGSCSNTVMEQVKARRTRGEISAPETERKGGPALKFQSKGVGAPEQATDSANQPFLQPRDRGGAPPPRTLETEQLVPVPQLPAGIAPQLPVPAGATTRPAQ